MKRLFVSTTFPDTVASIGLLAARLLVGIGLMMHGWPKIQKPTSWAGDSIPGFLQALAALAEFGGGLAFLIGLLVPLAALGVFITMAYAKFTVHASDPMVSMEGRSWESAGLYAAFAILFFTVGPGKYSLDYVLSQALNRSRHHAGTPTPTAV
jgi:putative oxidoreductase